MFMSRLFKGAFAGLAATVPMTIAMEVKAYFLPQHEPYSLPPRKVMASIASRIGLWQRTDKREHTALTFLAHFGYGAAAGALYAPFAARFRPPALLSGITYGLMVWATSYMGWLPAMRIERLPGQQPRSRNVQLIGSHIIWGATLGLMVDQIG